MSSICAYWQEMEKPMTEFDTSELVPLLELSRQEGSAEGTHILETMLEVLPSEGAPMPDGTPFDIQVLLDAEDSIVLATTRKVPNLRFRLGDFLLTVTKQIVELPGAISNPVSAALSVISFLRKLNDLATVPIDPIEAEVLLTIFRLTRERKTITVDELIAVTPNLKELRRIEALERLNKLGCIRLTMSNMQMNEEIIVKRR